jgi:hypothetical protein
MIFDEVVRMVLFAVVSLESTINANPVGRTSVLCEISSMTTNSIGPSSRGLHDLWTKRQKEAEIVIHGTIKTNSRNHDL